jgi:hypothetical protein
VVGAIVVQSLKEGHKVGAKGKENAAGELD